VLENLCDQIIVVVHAASGGMSQPSRSNPIL
jgi:hypothetical protein